DRKSQEAKNERIDSNPLKQNYIKERKKLYSSGLPIWHYRTGHKKQIGHYIFEDLLYKKFTLRKPKFLE
ncbi:14886_t:CDS:2, partial [Dentiscutata heterogama]